MKLLIVLTLTIGAVISHPSDNRVNSNDLTLKHVTNGNDGEYGSYFEGDMILSPAQLAALRKRNGLRAQTYRWTNRIIPYRLNGNFSQWQEDYIRRGLDTIELSTCLKFVPYTNQPDFIEVTSEEDGCWSYVGRQGNMQQLNLQLFDKEVSCFRLATIMHEFIHALGFFHMQSTYDRDDYVTIVWENIQPGMEYNFEKYDAFEVDDYEIKYDYSSVMHYGPTGFTINGQPTIVPKDPNANIGQRVGLSRKDIERLNRMYNCPLS